MGFAGSEGPEGLTLVRSESPVTRASVAEKLQSERRLRASVVVLALVLLPEDGPFDSGMVFPAGTRELFQVMRDAAPEGIDVEVACSDDRYAELTLHSEEWRLPLILVGDMLATPFLLDVLANYVYDKLKGLLPGRSAKVRSRIILETAKGSFFLEYDGPAEDYVETISTGIDAVKGDIESIGD